MGAGVWYQNSWSKVFVIFNRLEKPKDEEGYMIIMKEDA